MINLDPTQQPPERRFDGNIALPVPWMNFTADQEYEALLELHEWVQWLTGRYHLDARIIPECWPDHGELVEELSALRGGWATAFSNASTGRDTMIWHAEFAAARQRLSEWAARTGCRSNQHRTR
jgi:hypothetical protein